MVAHLRVQKCPSTPIVLEVPRDDGFFYLTELNVVAADLMNGKVYLIADDLDADGIIQLVLSKQKSMADVIDDMRANSPESYADFKEKLLDQILTQEHVNIMPHPPETKTAERKVDEKVNGGGKDVRKSCGKIMDDEMVLLAAAMKMAIAEQEEAEAAKETFLK